MSSGAGEVLVSLISYPVLIVSILVFAISLFFLIAKRRNLKKEVKVLLIVLAIISVIIIGFFVFLVFAFGNNHPPASPVPLP
jgi:NhaP-type Na+/H+ or K+/H+ antiporter